jgi:hypothetical protein
VGGFAVAAGGRLAPLEDAGAGAGMLVLLLGLALRIPVAIPWAVGLAAAGYLAGRSGSAAVDAWAAVVGPLLLLAAELGSWSIEHDARIRTEAAVVVRRLTTLVALMAAALLAGFLLLAVAAVSATPGLLLVLTGTAAAVAAVALVVRLARG